ncbi:MAG: energy transducer TonB [Alphaproteobacteria bacterium]|nr:energy transducer TonB [Alphaproteobacteria bacterium]
MTIPFPLDAFDHAYPVQPRPRRGLDRAKLVSIGITIAIHVLIAVAALTVAHVSKTKVMQELSVQIAPQKTLAAKEIAAPLPKLVEPTLITVPPPEVVISTPPPPITVQQSIAPAPPPPPAAAPGGTSEGRDSFLGRLLAQLNRFKQYPRNARNAGIEGVVMLHFVMNAQGKVISYEIAKSSGRPVLDSEALALIQRAQPLPALPADYPTRTLDAIVPIEFALSH